MNRAEDAGRGGVVPERLSVVVAVYRQPRQLEAVFAALEAGSRLPGEIVVADDGSGPETAEIVGRWAARLPIPVVHAWQEDRGYRRTRAGNLAFSRLTLDYVLLLDGDCVPSRRWVEDHAALAEPGCYVQPRRFQIKESAVPRFLSGEAGLGRLFLTGGLWNVKHAARLPRPLVDYDRKLDKTISCNFGLWRDDLYAVNGWNEDFVSYGTEDWELAARLINLGRQRKFVRGWAAVGHLNHPISPRVPEEQARNQAILDETVRTGRIRCERGLDGHL